MKWHELYSVSFKRLSPKEASIWEDEVSREVHDVGNNDLVEAVRSLANDAADDHRLRSPGPIEVAKRIKRQRWQSRGVEPERDGCSCCGGSGWMTFAGWIDSETSAMLAYGSDNEPDANENAMAYRGDVPCLCSKGETVAHQNHADGYKAQQMRREVKSWLDRLDAAGPDGRFSPDRLTAAT